MKSGDTKIELENNEKEKESNKLIEHLQGSQPATFEEAITATGYGKFNYFLLFCIIFPSAAQLTETVAISYMLPVAECDLYLSLEDKGRLNGVTFAGMIVSGLFWGYMVDALGRKQIIVYGYFVTSFFSLLAALSSNKTLLLLAKFLGGLILNGPFSATTTHIIEFHSSKYRGKINIIRGTILSVANIALPLLAWAVLPRNIHISLGFLDLRAWNVFLLIVGFLPLISGCLYIFVPESPKFLMSIGRNREALAIIQRVYSINTGNDPESFPIKSLTEETTQNFSSAKDLQLALKNGFSEMKSILHRPHINNLLLACFNVFSLIMSLNTLKLWLPGIFQSINDYQQMHDGASNSICVMLQEMNKSKNVTLTQKCNVNLDNISVYINTLIVAAIRIIAYILATSFLKHVGTKKLNIILCLSSALSMFLIYFAKNSITVTLLSAVGLAIGSVSENILVILTIEMFPTTLRTIALSIHLTSGRIGTLIGNLIFPYLVLLGCLPPFLFIGIFAAACGLLSLKYSNIENKPLV